MADFSLSRRAMLAGGLASVAMASAPISVRPATSAGRALTIRTRRMRRMAGIQRIAAPWLNAGFEALVARVGVRAVLARFFRGMYELEATDATLDRLEVLVAERGWPAALNRMTLLGGAKTGRPVRKLSDRHRVVVLTRLAQITRLYQSVANRGPRATEVLGALETITDYSRPIIEQSKPVAALRLGRTTASAQELEPITVTAPADPGFSEGVFGPATGQQFLQIIQYLVAQQQAQNAAAAQQVEAAYQAALNTFLQSPEMAAFGGEDARAVVDQLARQGLQETQILAALTVLGAAAQAAMAGRDMMVKSLPMIMADISAAIIAGDILVTVTLSYAAAHIVLVGGGVVLLGLIGIGVWLYFNDVTVTDTSVEITPMAPPDAVMDVDLTQIPDASMPESLIPPEIPDIETGVQGNTGEIAGPEPAPTPTPTLQEQFQSGYNPTIDPNASYDTWLAWYSWAYLGGGGFNLGSMSGG